MVLTDKWGHPFWYPTKKTAGVSGSGHGFFWEQSNDIHKDDDYEGDAMVRIGKEHDSSDFKVISTTTGEWQFPFNFDSGDGLSLSGPTGHHSGGETHGCQGFTYMINVSLNDDPPKFRFRKETYHVQYDTDPETGVWTHPAAPDKIVGGGWFGFGWVAYNKKDGRSTGKDSRIIEAWWNNDPEGTGKWVMLKRKEDKGDKKWGVSATCDGVAYQVGTWSNIQFRFKVDASDFSLHPLIPEPDDGPNIHSIGGEDMSFADSEKRGYGKRADMPRDVEMKCLFKFEDTSGKCRLKNVSLREIDPSLGFDQPDPETPTGGGSTIEGTFKMQWDVNTIGASECAGAGTGSGGGSTIFYPHSGDITDDKLFDTETSIVGQQVKTSASAINGKVLKQLDVPLYKAGTPSGSIAAGIWSNGGSLIYLSPTTFANADLTTSYVTKTFDFSANTHTCVVGDRIGVQYTAATSSNYIVCGFIIGDTIPTSAYTHFGGAWSNENREFCCDMWQ